MTDFGEGMKMLHVIFDTSILYSDKLRPSVEFQAIERLADSGQITIHMPHVVEMEHCAQMREPLEKKYSELLRAVNALKRDRNLSPVMAGWMRDAAIHLEDNRAQTIENIERIFNDWVISHKVLRHELCALQAKEALDNYFYGRPPLSQPKERKHIPDSFIVESIKKIIGEYDPVYLIAADKNLRATFEDDPYVISYGTLKEFCETDVVRGLLVDVDVERLLGDFRIMVCSLLDEGLNNFESTLISDLDSLVRHLGLRLPSVLAEGNECSVYSIPHSFSPSATFDPEAMDYIGSGLFGLPFKCRMAVEVEYLALAHEYESFQGKIMHHPNSVVEVRDGLFEINDTFEVEISGVITFEVDRDLLLDEVSADVIDPTSIYVSRISDTQEIKHLPEGRSSSCPE